MLPLSREAIEEARYLLERGYARPSVVRFVGDKHVLNKSQRLLLYRCVYPPQASKTHLCKAVSPECVHGNPLTIDGYNVLLTLSSAIEGRPIYLCDDGFVRDISARKRSLSPTRLSACLDPIIRALEQLTPSRVTFIYDKQVSRSGELASKTVKAFGATRIQIAARTSGKADSEALNSGEILATSDSVMIEKASRVFDLAGHIIIRHLGLTPTKI
ncbi:MAG: DUF434 domain-containing protein [Candidatus Methanomethylicia archaeon]|nr:DUF434 domain-containing protein [Candidatus Methanomethylicia archaeon]